MSGEIFRAAPKSWCVACLEVSIICGTTASAQRPPPHTIKTSRSQVRKVILN